MKKVFFSSLIIFLTTNLFGHDAHYEYAQVHLWKTNSKVIHGNFSYQKNNVVFIENEDHIIVAVPFQELSHDDQHYVNEKVAEINALNHFKPTNKQRSILVENRMGNSNIQFLVVVLISILVVFSLFFLSVNAFKKMVFPIIGFFAFVMFAFKGKDAIEKSTTDPAFVDEAFTPFKPKISTHWDDQYFYVESKGIPLTHEMMVGISSHGWQQQVPIPQCYVGSNAWQIPLNPVIAATPVPVDGVHFTRGAIGLAINGVPIFNPHTNTGVDAFTDGQLDNFGGHCGRADDYHYHTAPLHLYSNTQATMPIAFGLDGFAVYGSVEPDGGSMQTLDANHGHIGSNGVYHYHGSSTAPYMIANMVGEISEDSTHQIIPQPSAHPVRPSLTPLNGALITACTPNSANNGYNLTYTLNGVTDSVVYSWTSAGQYTFNFYTNGDGTFTSENHNGFVQCEILAALNELSSNNKIAIFPNPSSDFVTIQLNEKLINDFKKMALFDVNGNKVFQADKFQSKLNTSSLSKGVYLLKLDFHHASETRKIIIE